MRTCLTCDRGVDFAAQDVVAVSGGGYVHGDATACASTADPLSLDEYLVTRAARAASHLTEPAEPGLRTWLNDFHRTW
jgi:hypothetical protein